MLIALVIFIATLGVVIWQPRGLGIGWSALGGAAVALLAGVIRPSDIPIVWDIVWNATFTFVAVIIISLLLDEAGFFEWAALHVAVWGGGHGRRLFVLIILLGAAIAALFANDGAALILTPIVMEMLLALGFGPAASFAFVMATGFVADSTSLPLVVSNLVNIVSADFFAIGFADYAKVMFPVTVAALAATVFALSLHFRHAIPKAYQVHALRRPADAIRDPLVFRVGWIVLAVLLVGYFGAEAFGVPVSAVAGLGALALLIVAGRPWRTGIVGPERVIPIGRVVRDAPWQIVLFSLGMYLVVYGLRNEGLTAELSRVLDGLAAGGLTVAALGTGALSAALSSVMNNMPTVMVVALSIDGSAAAGPVREAMVYANVIGSDLGPKITPIGSLATLLWLHVLDRRGMHVGWGTYFRIGIALTLPVLTVTLLALAGWLAVGAGTAAR
ncbi:MAG: arsenical efflux pump membrane protein ArsB [Anaerolinea sp.]|nr:arsenical efflux pump membrane protein ArsB [Anaerolinea sp.]